MLTDPTLEARRLKCTNPQEPWCHQITATLWGIGKINTYHKRHYSNVQTINPAVAGFIVGGACYLNRIAAEIGRYVISTDIKDIKTTTLQRIRNLMGHTRTIIFAPS